MRKRKGFNPEHSNTFAKALAKINVPEDYLRNPERIDSIRWYRRLQDSQAPGSSSCRLWHGSRVVILKIEKSQ